MALRRKSKKVSLRRHQARRPPLAKIKPGRPAPTMGAGTAASPPNRICATVRQPNCTCERYTRDQFTARGRKRKEISSTSTERK
jgi:hypothetical protein